MANDNGNPSPIKVLIVDDEQLVRKGLRLTIDWEEHGMVVVDDAPNGSIGWQKFLRHRPHLVITDIVMPEMSGIELAQKIRQEAPGTEILFLSCHRDFNYAQFGIKIGVHDYIVKTDMDDDYINQSLHRIYERYEERASKQRAAAEPAEKKTDRARESLIDWLQGRSYTARDHLLGKLRTEWKWMLSNSSLLHIYRSPGASGPLEPLLHPLKDLSQAHPDRLKLLALDDDSAFLVCGPDTLDLGLSGLVELKISFRALEWRQSKPIAAANPDGWLDALSRLYRIYRLERNINLLSTAHKEDILQAIDFIDEHLDQDIRAADVAAMIGVSRSYFSTIFKEATGCSIISFIAERKLKRAMELLSATSIRTEEVAEKVGIQDVKYFSKWFKKQAEVTPGQYRLSNKMTAGSNK